MDLNVSCILVSFYVVLTRTPHNVQLFAVEGFLVRNFPHLRCQNLVPPWCEASV